jgi:L-rhamnose mutarotase
MREYKTKTVDPIFGPTNLQYNSDNIHRFSAVIGLKPEYEKQYRLLHADVWPEVLATIKRANIRNYSIFITEIDNKKYLFSYFEYAGENINRDLAQMALCPHTQRWWVQTDACQIRLPKAMPDEQWQSMEQVFFYNEYLKAK